MRLRVFFGNFAYLWRFGVIIIAILFLTISFSIPAILVPRSFIPQKREEISGDFNLDVISEFKETTINKQQEELIDISIPDVFLEATDVLMAYQQGIKWISEDIVMLKKEKQELREYQEKINRFLKVYTEVNAQ